MPVAFFFSNREQLLPGGGRLRAAGRSKGDPQSNPSSDRNSFSSTLIYLRTAWPTSHARFRPRVRLSDFASAFQSRDREEAFTTTVVALPSARYAPFRSRLGFLSAAVFDPGGSDPLASNAGLQHHQAAPNRLRNSFRPAARAELLENRCHVRFDGVLGDPQAMRDQLVALPFRDQVRAPPARARSEVQPAPRRPARNSGKRSSSDPA